VAVQEVATPTNTDAGLQTTVVDVLRLTTAKVPVSDFPSAETVNAVLPAGVLVAVCTVNVTDAGHPVSVVGAKVPVAPEGRPVTVGVAVTLHTPEPV
jgi:hypothetical protein